MARTIDPEALKSYAKHVFDALGGAMTSIMIWLGDRLGLYRALADGEPRTSADLAAQTGLNERWGPGMARAAGRVRHPRVSRGRPVRAERGRGGGPGRHLDADVRRRILRAPVAPQGGPREATGGIPHRARPVLRRVRPRGSDRHERGFAPWFRSLLVPMALPALPGVVDRLATGTAAADVGCGATRSGDDTVISVELGTGAFLETGRPALLGAKTRTLSVVSGGLLGR
jgi:hypothetical protein